MDILSVLLAGNILLIGIATIFLLLRVLTYEESDWGNRLIIVVMILITFSAMIVCPLWMFFV